MKHLCILALLTLFLGGNLSAQCQLEMFHTTQEYNQYLDCVQGSSLDAPSNPTPGPNPCGTDVTVVSVTNIVCGGVFGQEIVYDYVCTPGTSGVCLDGQRTEFDGCPSSYQDINQASWETCQ